MVSSTGKAAPLSSQDVFLRHMSVLNEHLQLWDTVRGEEPDGTATQDLAQTCFENTQKLIEGMHRFRALVDSNAKESTQNGSTQQQSLTETKSDPVEDSSGLFAIDTHPTPIDTLIQQNNTSSGTAGTKKEKRKLSEHPDADGKKRKSSRLSTDQKTATTSKPSISENPSDPNSTATAPVENDNDDSFATRVERRLNAKEVKRQRKADKKRKRESDGSTARPSNKDLINHLEPKLPPKKRRKQELKAKLQAEKEAAKAGGNDVSGAGIETSTTKKGKKNKRQSGSPPAGADDNGGNDVAATFLASVELPVRADQVAENGGEGGRKKRRKLSK